MRAQVTTIFRPLTGTQHWAVICLAHVTNQMGTIEGDFEKGEANGTADALAVLLEIVGRLGRPSVLLR